MNLTRNYFYFKGLKLSYLETGEATKGTIVITHANGYSAGCYSYILKHFTDFKIFALDFVGHGESDFTLDFKNWSFFRDQLLAFLEYLKLKEIIGIGHSLGGACWLMTAKLATEKVKKLILFDPTILDIPKILLGKVIGNPLAKNALRRRRVFKNKEQVKKIYKRFPAFANWDEEIFEDYLNSCFKQTEEGFELRCAPELEAKVFSSLSILSPLEYFFIKTETHIIIPKNYQVCSPSTAKRIVRGNPKSTLTVVPNFTHFFPFEEKEWVIKKLESLLG